MKRFLACVLCAVTALFCVVFAGCSQSYVIASESFKTQSPKVYYYLSLLLDEGTYNIKYTVYSEDASGNIIDELIRSDVVTVGQSNTANISCVFESASAYKVTSVKCGNIYVLPVSAVNTVPAHIIVLSVVSSLISAGLITLFVLDKKGKLKK